MNNFLDTWMSYSFLENFGGRVISSMITLGVLFLVIYLIRRVVSEKVQDKSVRYRLQKVIAFFGYLIFLIILLSTFKKDMGNFAVFFGIIAGGIAFSLQTVIASIAGWLVIIFSSFYKVGDRVKVGTITGDVIDIGVLSTTLMECGEWVRSDQYTGRVVRIANNFIFKDAVYNYSGEFPFLWDELKLPVHYGSPVNEVIELLTRVANEVTSKYTESFEERWKHLGRQVLVEDQSISPMVGVIATDNWIEFHLRYVVDYKQRRTTRTNLFIRILEEIEKTEGRIRLSSSTMEIVKESVY